MMALEIDLPNMVYFLLLGGMAFLIGMVGTRAFTSLMHERSILARPNERSMHTQSTPTGAGWVIVLFLLAVYLMAYGRAEGAGNWFIPLFTLILALVSWYDDKIELPPSLRFGIQLIAVATTLALYGGHSSILWDGWPLWVDRIIVGLCWLWFINLFNFMDGIDGIAGVEVITVGFGLLSVGLIVSLPLPVIEIMIALIGVSLGFLGSNWHPAKVYMGDTGSIPLGFLLGWLLIQLAQKGYLIPALLIPAYFVADASYTLIRRMLNGEPFLQAHCTHLYQLATKATRKPDFVVSRIAVGNVVLIFAALVSVNYPAIGLLTGGLTVVVLLVYLNWLGQKK